MYFTDIISKLKLMFVPANTSFVYCILIPELGAPHK